MLQGLSAVSTLVVTVKIRLLLGTTGLLGAVNFKSANQLHFFLKALSGQLAMLKFLQY